MSEDSLPPPPLSAPRVLVVVGDPDRRENLQAVLLAEGYEVPALAGEEGLVDEVRSLPPDLILLETRLPDASGYELCGDLRMLEATHLVPIILLVPTYDEMSVVRGLLCGADDVVGPQTPLAELKARVRVQFRRRRMREIVGWARQQRETLRRAGLIDPVTRIPNRRAADEALAEALLLSLPTTLVLTDLDRFTDINQTHGEAAGDQVLRAVGQALRPLAPPGGAVARTGCDEFVVVLPGVAGDESLAAGERFRKCVAGLSLKSPEGLRSLTASVGVAVWNGAGSAPHPDAMMQAAELALYDAKEAGLNRVVVWPMESVMAS
ncbi:MAG: diguanylate cyclase [Deltaproteobacteria bacterium]|nr:diguanylate cyclase [Deltaproteobacteria bacterium]